MSYSPLIKCIVGLVCLVSASASAVDLGTITSTNCMSAAGYSQTTVIGNVGDTFTLQNLMSGQCNGFISTNTAVFGPSPVNLPANGGSATFTLSGAGTATLFFVYFSPITVTVNPSPTPTVNLSTANLAINATTLAIDGTGFDTTAGNNTVAFNLGAAGTVTSATANQLIINVTTPPSTTGSLTAVVTTNSQSSGSAVQVATVVLATQVTLVVVPTPSSINVNGSSSLSTTGGSGLGAVSYSLVSGPCTLSGATLTGTGAGSCIVTATKAADSTYASATSSSAIVTVLQSQESGNTPGGTVNTSITGGGFVAGSTQFTAVTNPPAGKTFPYGVFGFTAQTTPGGTVTVTITYPQPLPAGTQYLKSINGAWVDWTSRVSVSGSTVTLPLTGGQYGDTNPASGLITDPFGPAVSSVTPSPEPIPTLSEWALIMMMFLMIVTVGWYGRRLKQ